RQLSQITGELAAPMGMSPERPAEIYEERKRAGVKVWQDVYRLSHAFESMGVPKHVIARQATESGLSKKRVGLAMAGYMERPVLSKD
ncbi:hypothetical protein, partial [Legionella anisa]|uniref:hypothetical protein n=1 Tax=Legionella anisa TaxID=28082 RepID=UPI00399D40D5